MDESPEVVRAELGRPLARRVELRPGGDGDGTGGVGGVCGGLAASVEVAEPRGGSGKVSGARGAGVV